MNNKPKLKTTRVELRLAPNQKEALLALTADDSDVKTMSAYIVKMLDLPEPLDEDGNPYEPKHFFH